MKFIPPEPIMLPWKVKIPLAILAFILPNVLLNPKGSFEFMAYLSNMDMRERGWNIAAVVWIIALVSFSSWKYYILRGKALSKSRSTIVFSIFIGTFSAVMYYFIIDETSLWLFVLTRTNVATAINTLFLIPDKWIRYLILIPMCWVVFWKYGKVYINGKVIILMVAFTMIMNAINIAIGYFDMRSLAYPDKTIAYIAFYLPTYFVNGYGYCLSWRKVSSTSIPSVPSIPLNRDQEPANGESRPAPRA